MAIGAEPADSYAGDYNGRCLQTKVGEVYNCDVGVTEEKHHKCPKCEKVFGHRHLLQLHLQVHYYGAQKVDDLLKQGQGTSSNHQTNNTAVEKANSESSVIPNSTTSTITTNQTSITFPAKRAVGLTKIKLEDCLRCDACSCIYIDKNDYNKHMRNFHQKTSSKKQKTKKECKSCCRHCNCKGNHKHHSVEKEMGNNNLFHYNIKDRWSKMVTQRINKGEEEAKVKQEPCCESDTLDFSHLLSQVEVKIKTEPPDEEDYNAHIQTRYSVTS